MSGGAQSHGTFAKKFISGSLLQGGQESESQPGCRKLFLEKGNAAFILLE